MKINFRKYNSKDINQVAKIYSSSFSESPYNEPWTLIKAIKKIKIFMRYCDLYVACDDNKVVGFLAINPYFWCPGEFLFGEELAVLKEYRGQNIGKNIIDWVLQKYKKKGFKRFVFVANRESKAYRLYKNWGFEESTSDAFFEKEL
jgi:predicted N-acetyltransferase YhbS